MRQLSRRSYPDSKLRFRAEPRRRRHTAHAAAVRLFSRYTDSRLLERLLAVLDRARAGMSILELLDDRLLAVVASPLRVQDLGRLACVAKRFDEKHIFVSDNDGGSAAAVTMMSIVGEAARIGVENFGQSLRAKAPRDRGQPWLRIL